MKTLRVTIVEMLPNQLPRLGDYEDVVVEEEETKVPSWQATEQEIARVYGAVCEVLEVIAAESFGTDVMMRILRLRWLGYEFCVQVIVEPVA